MRLYNAKRNRGQSLVEFAITIPILLLFIIFLWDISRTVLFYASLQNAAREGARYGIIPVQTGSTISYRTEGEIRAIVQARAIALSPVTVTTTPALTINSETLTVNASYSFTPITPFIGPLTLNTSATMHTEW